MSCRVTAPATDMGKHSGFCLTVFFAGLLNIDAITGDISECANAAVSGDIPYIRMCEDARVTSDRMILDTHLAAATGETTCSCSAETNVSVVFYLQYYGVGLNPNTTGCVSRIVITSPTSFNSPFECNTSTSNPLVALPMNLTWSGASVGDSKYCIDITTDPSPGSKHFTMVCSKPGTTFTTFSTRPSTTKAAETTVQTTTVTETRTTNSEGTTFTSAMTTVSNTDQGTSRRAGDTRTDTNPQRPKDSVPLIIAIPAAVGGFVLIITIVIIAVVFSK
ncbi:uncharacterized protein LOC110452982 [Mizuhopecten yessoensis]|uniref:Uncharacterized protein n=1 Tax=Mizuhopecten yessoensis TaxID=6573 RepID=A0A210QIE6_MIZYE|nr:uncharacterized protein LOC110452982 [Mizuhopecten yessoensis]OWF48512.1 hypothetical protein KP79_PYT06819 [Mizuhopecten yessoensis]